MSLAIRMEGLGKRYRIGGKRQDYRTLRDALVSAATVPLRAARLNRHRAKAGQDFIWSLKELSLDIRQGEVVGIIGRNGAGKSTLLKILSRITEPTEGWADVAGRVGALLEVGTGFHPELTGRENIYLNGAILGMRRAEIRSKFDDIVDFAEVERFIDTPVKHYSSGMYVRLAFAVAAHLEPEILLVDEVLAVGDAAFQKKCLGRMGTVSKQGRTILFVSHNMAAISGFCSSAVMLEQGRVVAAGATDEVVGQYLKTTQVTSALSLAERTDRRGDGSFRFLSLKVADGAGEALETILAGQRIRFIMRYATSTGKPLRNTTVSLAIFTSWGQLATNLWTEYTGDSFEVLPPEGSIACEIPSFPLVPGSYSVSLSAKVQGALADRLDDAFNFDVIEGDFFGTGKAPKAKGVCLIPHSWGLLD